MRRTVGNLATTMWQAVSAPLRWARASMTWAELGRWIQLGGGDRENVTRPMAQSPTVFRGIHAVAATLSGLRTQLDRGTPDSIITSGPAFELLREPMRGMTTQEWMYQIAGHLVEGGECHIFDPDVTAIRPKLLLPVGKRQMEPRLNERGEVIYWQYTPQNSGQIKAVSPEWDAMLRLFNPYDPNRGLSPLAASQLDVQQSYAASQYNARALRNGGAPGGLLKVPGSLTSDERRELERTLQARFEGPENANKTLVGTGGMEWQSISWKNTDLELVASRKLSREEILSALGVPPVLAGIFEAAHYDVADQSIQIFLLHTIAPLARLIEATINLRILPRIEPGVRFQIDTNDHPAMLAVLEKKIGVAQKACDLGTPYNEAVRVAGLPLRPLPWGDTSIVPSGRASIDDVIAGAPEPLPASEQSPSAASDEATERRSDGGAGGEGGAGNSERDRGIEGSRDRERETAGVAAERRAEEAAIAKAMPMIRRMFRAHFARQLNRMLPRLRAALRGRDGAALQRASESEDIARKVLLDLAEEADKLRVLVKSYFPASIETALRAKLKDLGLSTAEIDKAVTRLMAGKETKALLRIQQGKIVGIERTTRQRVYRSLVEGLDKGETTTELSGRLREVLTDQRQVRVNAIARNEAGQAVATGRYLAASTSGAKYKAWLTGRNPRPTHTEAGNTYSANKPIPMDEPFEIGQSSLMFPRDPRGSAGEIINCNCLLISRRKPKADKPSEDN